MNNSYIILLLVSLVFVSSVNAQVISKPEARSDLLTSMDQTLSNMQREGNDFKDVKSPFVAVMPEKQPVVVEQVEETVAPVVAARLPDKEALAIISQQFKPLGSLILGNRGVLQLQANKTIEKGAFFNADISGNTYRVEILDVTSRGYTLRLGTAQVTKNFLTTSGTAQ